MAEGNNNGAVRNAVERVIDNKLLLGLTRFMALVGFPFFAWWAYTLYQDMREMERDLRKLSGRVAIIEERQNSRTDRICNLEKRVFKVEWCPGDRSFKDNNDR